MFSTNPEMLTYYNKSGDKEWRRLETLWIEFFVNSAFMRRYLNPKSRILDIGAGPGRYSIALAKSGHSVWVADPAAALIEQAKLHVTEAGVQQHILGFDVLDVRDLGKFPNGSFDAVLAMGPFYHLQDPLDRAIAAREISRVLRPGGFAFLAFIPRTYIVARCLADPGYFKSIEAPEELLKFWTTGCYESSEPGRWTGVYCGRIREMCDLFMDAGLERCQLISSESVTMYMNMERLSSLNQIDEPARYQIETLLIETAEEPEMSGLSFHALYVGKRKL
jgi:ubiquinone/menaquinone biosynthesis C-methylase UbiE